jgi:hypothetical protein
MRAKFRELGTSLAGLTGELAGNVAEIEFSVTIRSVRSAVVRGSQRQMGLVIH